MGIGIFKWWTCPRHPNTCWGSSTTKHPTHLRRYDGMSVVGYLANTHTKSPGSWDMGHPCNLQPMNLLNKYRELLKSQKQMYYHRLKPLKARFKTTKKQGIIVFGTIQVALLAKCTNCAKLTKLTKFTLALGHRWSAEGRDLTGTNWANQCSSL